jgi:hypothetical protein
MLRSIPVLVLSCLLLTSTNAFAAESYAAMVERVKKGDATVDYRALRDAYSASPAYQPYGVEARDEMRKAFAAKDCPNTIKHGEKVLNEIYIDVLTHLLTANCLRKGNDEAKADFHRAIGRSLLDSIAASGDGKSPQTAFIVVTIDEEYDLLGMRGLTMKSQALVHTGGHSFDQMSVVAEDGTTSTLFFQIDRPMGWLTKTLTTP